MIVILVGLVILQGIIADPAYRTPPIPNGLVSQILPLILTRALPFLSVPTTTNSNANLPEDFLLTDSLVKNRGYGYELHKVETEDGYILSLHRIIPKNEVTKLPVLIQHGVLASSDSWVMSANSSLAFSLADSGHEVWLADQRGSAYSKGHKYYSVKEFRYWNFTFHEAGMYDVPAFIDRVLAVTGNSQLFYIGHSMGTTVFLTMASLRPEYNNKVKAAVLLAPVATTPTLSEIYQTVLRLAILYSDSLKVALIPRKAYEFLPRTGQTIKAIRNSCAYNSPSQDLCLDIIGMAYGEHRANVDRKTVGKLASYLPSGSSLLTVHHLSQMYKIGFRWYDYGQLKNMQVYGSSLPPFYPLEKIKTPVALFYGDNDALMSKKGAFLQRRVYEMLPRTKQKILNVRNFCASSSSTIDFCLDVVGLAIGEHRANVDKEKLAYMLSYSMTGTSSLNLHHYSQIYKKGFRLYDHGKKLNLKAYNAEEPPFYPLDKVTTPIALMYGDNDVLINERSVNDLAAQLPNCILNHKVKDPKFNHADVVIGLNAKEMVFDHIISLFESYSNNKTLNNLI